MSEQALTALSTAILIECLIRRPGGTHVPFGKNATTAKVYHFKPQSGDANDISVPHVCEVEDDDHIGRLLSITEGYRRYSGQGATLPSQIGMSTQDNFVPENPYEDLLTVDPEAVDSDWLVGYSRAILKIGNTNKQKLAEFLKANYGLEADEGDTANQIIRKILAQHVNAEKLAHAAAGGNQSIST